jgi:hypothetical protein
MLFAGIAKVEEIKKEVIEKGKELNAVKSKVNTRKEHGIKQFQSITIEAKQPGKIDTQIPLTVQLKKDMQSPQNGVFSANRFSKILFSI